MVVKMRILLFLLAVVVTLLERADSWQWEAVDLQGYSFFPRSSFGAHVGDNGDVAYFFGGSNQVNFTQPEYFNDLAKAEQDVSDPSKYTMVELTSTSVNKPSKRRFAAMAVAGDYILVSGGIGEGSAVVADVSWLYQISARTWTNVTQFGPDPFSQAAAVSSSDGKIYIYGGLDGIQATQDYWQFDPTIKGWKLETIGFPDASRFGAKGIMVDTEISYFYGGISSFVSINDPLSNIVMFNGMSNRSVLTPGSPDPKLRFAGFAPFDSQYNTFILIGGSMENGTNDCTPAGPALKTNPYTYIYNRSANSWDLLNADNPVGLIDGAALFLDQRATWFGGFSYSCPVGQVFPSQTSYALIAPTAAPTKAPTLRSPGATSAPGTTFAPTPAPAPTTSGAAGWSSFGSTTIFYLTILFLVCWVMES